MLDPPENCATDATDLNTRAAEQLGVVVAEDANSAHLIATQANATPVLNNETVIADTPAITEDDIAASASVDNTSRVLKSNPITPEPSTATLTCQHPVAVSEEATPISVSNNLPLFTKLPGELRNRIYRAYFEDFVRQREYTINIRKAAPTFLNLLHADHMIRSEAVSIFFKEFLSVDSFFVPANLEGAIKLRIRAICALVAIHGISLPLSITVQQRTVDETGHMPNMRSDFVGKLMRFLTGETNEWFARSTDPKKPEEQTHLPSHPSVRPESMVHSSRRYRIERLQPDAASSQRRALLQQNTVFNATANQHVHSQQFLGLQGAHQPDQESNDFLRVEGPLAELDWSKFEWNVFGAYERWQAPPWVHRGR